MTTRLHDDHRTLPRYHPEQVFVDGCAKCESHARSYDYGIADLDPTTFAYAVARARMARRHGLTNMADTEWGLLCTLWSVTVQFENAGVFLPTRYVRRPKR